MPHICIQRKKLSNFFNRDNETNRITLPCCQTNKCQLVIRSGRVRIYVPKLTIIIIIIIIIIIVVIVTVIILVIIIIIVIVIIIVIIFIIIIIIIIIIIYYYY